MSCLHIQGTHRDGSWAPLKHLGRDKTDQRIAGVVANAKHENPKIRAAAAASPVLPLTEQINLALDGSVAVREWLAQNTYASPAVLASLVSDEDYRVRARAVWNPSTPRNLVETASATDTNEMVRRMAQIVLDNSLLQ